MGFRVYLNWRSDPSALIRAVTTPGSPQYRHYLTPEQFRADFAPTAADAAAVQKWLRSAGFTIDYTPANNLYVAAEGNVSQVNAAFGTTIGNFTVQGKTLRAPETTPSVPASLPQVTVVGLDDSAALVHTDQAAPAAAPGTSAHTTPSAPPSSAFVNAHPCGAYWGDVTTATASATISHLYLLDSTTGSYSTLVSGGSAVRLPSYPNGASSATPYTPCGYTPAQLRSAYELGKSDTGAGQTVAIIDAYASPTIVQDVNEYFNRNNVNRLIPPLTSSNFTQVVAPGTYRVPNNLAQYPSDWYGEETLDVEAVHTMAPDAHIVFVGAPNAYQDLDAALNHVVDQHLASMVTNSYGWSGEALPRGFITPVEHILQEAAATGVGVYFSSGDCGDETACGSASPTPDYPASSPWVTAVGGTSLQIDSSSARTGEWGWETGIATLTQDSSKNLTWGDPQYSYGSGGGVSALFAQPSWQVDAASSVNTKMRVVPDVSMVGDPNTGMLVGQTQTFPDGTVAYGEYRIGGTSLSSPLFTGVMADVQAAAGSKDIGFANPMLYAEQGAFKDITPAPANTVLIRSDFVNYVDDTNGYKASARLIDYENGQSLHVMAGYDDVTGLGSPNGQDWMKALATYAPQP